MKIATFFLLILLLSSCSNNENTTAQILEKAPHDLVLDNDAKWEVVPDMMKTIQLFATSIVEFDGTTIEEHQALSKQIEDNLNTLTSNCTMTGQAHDELHKWLLPFLDTSREFADATKLSEMENSVISLKNEIHIFQQYFE